MLHAGQHPDPALIDSLLHARPANSPSSAAPAQLNFTAFVTLMASHLSALDPESDMLDAFACFDERNTGYCDADEVREWLKSTGDRMSDDEVRLLFLPARRSLARTLGGRASQRLSPSAAQRRCIVCSSADAPRAPPPSRPPLPLARSQVDKLLHPPFLDRKTNQFNYRLFCQTLRIADDGGAAGEE